MTHSKTRADGTFKKYPCKCGGEHRQCSDSRTTPQGNTSRKRTCTSCGSKMKTIELAVVPAQRTLVIIESPYAGDVEENVRYARACVKDSLLRGEAPIASHLLYTQPGILDDDVPAERTMGIDAGLEWRRVSEKTVVYTDNGISSGMKYGIKAAEEAGNPVEYRELEGYSGDEK